MDGNPWNYIFNAHHIVEVGGLIILLIIIYLETGFFLGFILPGGDYLIFIAGVLCGSHFLDVPLALLLFLMVAASFAGDLTGFYKGKWLGNKLFTSNNSRFFKVTYLERANVFYRQFGLWAFVIGRFLPIVRTLVPMIAGATGFNFRKFLLFNLFGAVTWIGTLVPLGYYIGKIYPAIMDYSYYILLVIVFVVSIPVIKMFLSKNKKPWLQ